MKVIVVLALVSLSLAVDAQKIIKFPGDSNLDVTISQWKPLRELWEIEQLEREKSKGSTPEEEYIRSQQMYRFMKVLLRLLEYVMGPRGPRVEVKHFINWDHTVEVNNVFYTCPETLLELRTVVSAARRLGMRIRATGIAHSRSPLYTDEGHIMLDTRRLRRHDGPQIELHPGAKGSNPRVTVMTGVIAEDFYRFLVDNQLTVLAAPIVPNETVGGMVALSSHGSTWSAPGFGGSLVAARLVDSSGRVRYYNQHENSEVMRALRCHLGTFGIIYDMTLEVFPMKVAKVTTRFVRLSSVFYHPTAFRNLVQRKFLTEITWYPGDSLTDQEAAFVVRTGKVPRSWNAKRDLVWVRTIDLVNVDTVPEKNLQKPIYLPTGGAISGGNVTGILRGRVALKIARQVPSVSYHYLVDAFPIISPGKRGHETSSAFILNADRNFRRPLSALRFIIEEAERQVRLTGRAPMNALLPRFVLNSDCFLCPATKNIQQSEDSGRSMVIDYLAPPTQEGFYTATEKFVSEFRSERVRPHWGKRHTDIPEIFDVIKNAYRSNIRYFRSVLQNSGVDPSGMFTNKYTNCLLYSKCAYQIKY